MYSSCFAYLIPHVRTFIIVYADSYVSYDHFILYDIILDTDQFLKVACVLHQDHHITL